jgi:hypothetical protein
LLTGMTGISLHMQWPLTSQLHGENKCFFCYLSNFTPKNAPLPMTGEWTGHHEPSL